MGHREGFESSSWYLGCLSCAGEYGENISRFWSRLIFDSGADFIRMAEPQGELQTLLKKAKVHEDLSAFIRRARSDADAGLEW